MADDTPVAQDTAGLLRWIVGRAVLAPSSHNTQTWLFRIAGSRLELYADRTRALVVNDPHDRELTISCAAALLNARLAAEHAGARLDVVLLPEGDQSDLLARATLADDGGPDEWLFATVAARRTYRKDFAEREVPADARAALARAAAAESARLHVLDADARVALASLVARGDRAQFADPRWRRELASWMHPRRRGEGLVVGRLTGPATRLVVSRFDVGRGVAGRDGKLAERSPLLAVLATDGDTVADWMRAGQALQRLLLTATAARLQASYLNQPIRVDELRPCVAGLLGDAGVPQLALRLGHPPDEVPAAPRRSLDAVLEATGT
jgi:nitroreductase